MVSFEGFAISGSLPIYTQLILYIKRGIVAGTVCGGDELPSRRVLSALLGVNPNTVQKAYHLLEEEGIIESRSGARSFVTADGELKLRLRAELLERDAAAWVSAMKQMGLTREEALRMTEVMWDKTGGEA